MTAEARVLTRPGPLSRVVGLGTIYGKTVRDTRLAPAGGEARQGPLVFGAYPPHGLGCAGLVDEVRISRGARGIDRVPAGSFPADNQTIGLWHLDRAEGGRFEDASKSRNPAVIGEGMTQAAPSAGPSSATELDYKPADPRLKAGMATDVDFGVKGKVQ